MVVACEQIAEHIERVGFNALRQLLRTPGLANLVLGAVTVALGKQDPRERKPAPAGRRLASREAAHRRGIAALLPQSRLRPPAERARARPVRVDGDESGVAAKIRFSVRVAQDEPFDEFLGGRIANGFFDYRRFAGLGLAHQIERLPDRGQIAGQWGGRRSLRRFFDRRCRLMPRRRLMRRVLALLERGIAVMAAGSRIRLPGVLNLLVAAERYRVVRKRDEHGEAKPGQRPKASVHSVIPRELRGENHEIARSVRFELHGGYHTTSSRLSRFGNSTGKTWNTMEPKALQALTRPRPRSPPPTTTSPTACA